MASGVFHFKKFSVDQTGATHPVGTDGVLLGAWAPGEGARKILDIGTGSGLIALMIAQRFPEALQIVGIDIHAPSAALAARNFSNSPWKNRLSAIPLPLQAYTENTMDQFDLIVSNPPFFSELTRSPDAVRSLGRHTATLSWSELVGNVMKLLSLKGKLCVVLPFKEGKQLIEKAALHGLFCSTEIQVLSKSGKSVERLLLGFERNPAPFERSTLTIMNVEGEYTNEFKALTREFYLAF